MTHFPFVRWFSSLAIVAAMVTNSNGQDQPRSPGIERPDRPATREGDRPRPEGDRPATREGDRPRPEGDRPATREGDRPRPEGGRFEPQTDREELLHRRIIALERQVEDLSALARKLEQLLGNRDGEPRSLERPRTSDSPGAREGDRPRPEGDRPIARDGDRPRPEGDRPAPREGDRPAPREGDRPAQREGADRAEQLFGQYDRNRDRSVGIEEFLSRMEGIDQPAVREKWTAFFRRYDLNRNGKWDPREFINAYYRRGSDQPDREGDRPRPEGDRPAAREGDRPRPEGDRPAAREGDRPRPEGDRPAAREGDRPRPEGDRPRGDGN
ncbi:MAG: hypothetical protein VX715_10320 [Planctomycetota bacterium]|nr:hypothetical protein [Planctomycetota bacterium]